MYSRYKNDSFINVPDDKRLPIFLVPYVIKPGFNKKVINKYITFELEMGCKHPWV